jgi:hypothetical protein
MPRNVSGVYLLPASSVNPPVPSTTIVSADYQSEQVDIGNEITNSLDRLGRAPMLNDLPMGGFNLANLGSIKGKADGTTGAPGFVSENFTYSVASSAVASGVASTMAQLNLTAGRWIVAASCQTLPNPTTTTQSFQFYLSNTSAGSTSYIGSYAQTNVHVVAGQSETLNWMTGQVISSGVPFTIYFVVNVVFAVDIMNVGGTGGAIRLL